MVKSDGKIWVLDSEKNQYHYTFSETDTGGIIVHNREWVDGINTCKFLAEEDDPKDMRPRWNTMVSDGYRRNKMMEQEYGSVMTFDDLEFEDISETSLSGNKRAILFFKNGYGISVLWMPHDTHSHEVAVLKGVDSEWDICYDTPVTSDVIGCGNTAEIDEVMRKIQELDDDV